MWARGSQRAAAGGAGRGVSRRPLAEFSTALRQSIGRAALQPTTLSLYSSFIFFSIRLICRTDQTTFRERNGLSSSDLQVFQCLPASLVLTESRVEPNCCRFRSFQSVYIRWRPSITTGRADGSSKTCSVSSLKNFVYCELF